MPLAIGDEVPAFKAVDDEGNSFDFAELLGQKHIVLYFYPKDFTPGCTKEACMFRDVYAQLAAHDVEVVGVSADPVFRHAKFKEKYQLPFVLLTDADQKLRRLFGIKNYFFGLIPGRETLIIDKNGILRYRLSSIKASIHIEEALSEIKKIANEN